MSVWSVPGVEQEPEILVRPWLVIECGDGNRYVMGYCPAAGAGRTSTAIVEQDFSHRRVRTRSGRLYRLEGPPALDADAAYLWVYYALANGLHGFHDVSGEFWSGYRPEDTRVVDSRLEELNEALKHQR